MTYEEFKNTYTFSDIKTKKLDEIFSKQAEDDLLQLLFMFPQDELIKIPSDTLTKEELSISIQQVFNKLNERFENDKKNRILSYEDFKKITIHNWLNSFNIDLYTDDELFNVGQWAKQAEEELYQARMHDRIIVEGIEPKDFLTEEEENTPIQQLIDEAKSKWTK